MSLSPALFIAGKNIPRYSQLGFGVIKELYPSGLVLTINNGTLRSNVDEPFYIDFPKSLTNINKKSHFIAIDTKNTYTDLTDYNSWIIATKKNVYTVSDDKTVQSFSLNEINGYYILNKEVFVHILNTVKPYLSYLPLLYISFLIVLFFIFPIIFGFFYFLGLLFFLLFFSYLFYLFFRSNRSFKSVFHISLHAISASLIFQLIQAWLQVTVFFSFALPFIIWMLFILKNIDKDEYTNPTTSQTD